MVNKLLLLTLLLIPGYGFTQNHQAETARKYIIANQAGIISEYTRFLSIPNVNADPGGLQRNAEFICEMMKGRGINNVQLLKANSKATPPAVYGEILVPGAKQTLLFYAHYDGQPVNPSQWAKGLEPFKPLLFDNAIDKGGKQPEIPSNGVYDPNWRIYARGASDDKAGIYAIIHAFEVLKKTGQSPSLNIKFFFEGEEELGSAHLDEIMDNNKPLLQSDIFIICDGPVHQSGTKQIVFGARGDTHLDLTVYGAKRPLHSGHYGNWAPNPAMMLARLLSSMKDENGIVTIGGFYDDVKPLTPLEQKALQEVPSVDEQMQKELGTRLTEMKGKSLSEAINLPGLNINGMQSGNVGKQSSNQIPTYATAVLDLRLVLGNDWKRQQQKVIDHIIKQGYFVIDHEPSDEERNAHEKIIKITRGENSYNAQRTSIDIPVIQKVITAVQSTTANKLVLQPTMGGSLPLFLFEKHLNAVTITVPIANHDNNQHAENENIRIGNLLEGIVTMATIMLLK